MQFPFHSKPTCSLFNFPVVKITVLLFCYSKSVTGLQAIFYVPFELAILDRNIFSIQPKKNWPRWVLPVVCTSRLLFIPLFMFCNAQPRNFSVIFNHDAFPSIFMLLFSTTNGYFGSLAMMYGPR